MVDISSQNNKINVTVLSSGNTANTNVTPDYAQYYSEKSKEWAISNRIVDNTGYSSKYYANESKKQADISTAKATEVVESGNTAVSNIESARNNALSTVNQGVNQLNTTITEGVETIETLQADSLAEITTNKETALSEISQAETNVLTNIDTSKLNTLAQIEELANLSIENINATGIDTKVSKSGDTMTGDLNIKTSSGGKLNLKNSTIAYADTVSANTYFGNLFIQDKNNESVGVFETYKDSNNTIVTRINTRGANGTWASANMGLAVNSSGTAYTFAPTPATNDRSTKIATTAFVGNVLGSALSATVSKTNNGYIKFSNGIIIQWGGSSAENAKSDITVTFPKSFTATPRLACVRSSGSDTTLETQFWVRKITSTNFKWYTSPTVTGITYIAIGY